ncbi:Uncharacterized [Syntrophomonas zehnderi OL-4]|uniref:Uncharacterized n=1 Tax=Syntrophomonas zehnderi OL-4 TaxID=690567 RepID=A0A0E4G986_9FIRM|nr:hypothetical protein [Syntrophomonas zehnderi]CFX09823.1 Uncharacterized [Syntrophomonas zehnderi OL-4]
MPGTDREKWAGIYHIAWRGKNRPTILKHEKDAIHHGERLSCSQISRVTGLGRSLIKDAVNWKCLPQDPSPWLA